MTITEDALYEPLRDLVLTRFGTPAGAGVQFRFDRFGSVLTAGDFVVPGQEGYSPVLAAETFAELVNRVPVDLGERDVAFSEGGLDDAYYYRLLSPAVPVLPPTLSDVERQAVLETFSRIKADALKQYESGSLATVRIAGQKYRASTATPRTWYDTSSGDGWAAHSFDVKSGGGGGDLRWRLKLDDVSLQSLGVAADAMSLDGIVANAQADTPMPVAPSTDLAAQADLHDRVQEAAVELPMSERIVTHRYLAARAPSVAASMTGDLSVSFEYCLVRIDRQWLLRPFLDQPGWYVPGQRAGFAPSSWPIGVLALRNLEISGPWSDEDVAASAVASDFGPFRVSGGISEGMLRAQGLQVAGWLFERLGTLPPVDAPGVVPPPPPPPRRYTVVAGDSLWRIATTFYGDGARWPDIAAANHLPDPNALAVGQVLVVP